MAESKGGLRAAIASKEPARLSDDDYKRFVRDLYDGPAGAFTSLSGVFTGHERLAGKLIRPGAFDVRGCKSILDAGCGNGRYSHYLLKTADADAKLSAFDLSEKMLARARKYLASDRVTHIAADVTRLPYADGAFDAAVCGWMLEHLTDPRPGLRELSRVLRPGGKLLLMCTENTLAGAVCSHFYHCRTYDRAELRKAAAECGLTWGREYWFSKLHERFRLGGIVVELKKN